MNAQTGKITYPLELFEKIKKRYPPGQESALTIPFLKEIQNIRGYIANEDIDFLAKYLSIPKNQIEEDISFYTLLRRTPQGKNHIQVCRNISCSMMGANHIVNHLCEQLGIKPGETSRDGKFTLSLVECLALCGTAPVMQINDQYYENLTPEKISEILEGHSCNQK